MSETADRARLLDLLRASTANYNYFFEHVDDPGWLSLLVEAGFFTSPPEPERDEGWVRFPGWPESRYLLRVVEQVPEQVLETALAIPETENVRVHEDLLRIAERLPAAMGARIARQEAKWLAKYEGPLMSLPGAAPDLLAALARGGRANDALRLARSLLRIVRADGRAPSRRRATSLMNERSYGQIIEHAWPALMAAEPRSAFRFLGDRLRDVVQIAYIDRTGFDASQAWRSAIESHAQNLSNSLFDTLVDAVRDTAVEHAATAEGLKRMLDALQHYDGTLFRRIELHLLQHRADADSVAAALTDASLARDTAIWHEYGELLRTRYIDLSPAQQNAVLRVIAAGPGGEVTTDDDAVRHRRWKLLRYALIADHLTGDARTAYEVLTAEFGEPEHPTFLRYGTSWTGPTSPLSADELKAMGPAEAARAMRRWTPPGGPDSPTPEGLGRELSAAVAADVNRFSCEATEFIDSDPTYVRGVLSGLAEAAKAERPVAWGPVLALCEWVVAQPRSSDDAATTWDQDPHWGWARQQIAGLFSQGFNAGDAEIPEQHTTRVWDILEVLATDPDPSPPSDDVPAKEDDDLDALTTSINTTRGEALHAVVRYAIWRERALEARDAFDGVASLPEVTKLLEHHLDPANDASPAIRAVYGSWFVQFVRLDRQWAREIAPHVFPVDPAQATLFDAAWHAYINYTRAWVDVLDVIRDAYTHAIGRLDPERLLKDRDETAQHLGEHLIFFRVFDRVGLGEDDLFARYWHAVPADLRRQVIERVGWSLEQTTELDPDVRERFVDTWKWIVRDAKHDEQAPTLAGFATWLAARELDGRWLIEQARGVLRLGVHLDPAYTVYRALPGLAPADPGGAIEVLRLMITTDREGWSISGSDDDVRTVLDIALKSSDAEVRAQARAVTDLLLARGFTGFRDLVGDQ